MGLGCVEGETTYGCMFKNMGDTTAGLWEGTGDGLVLMLAILAIIAIIALITFMARRIIES